MKQPLHVKDAPAPVLRGPAIGPSHNVVGATHIYKLLPSETAGKLAIWEVIVEPGDGAPPHHHADEDEAFYVIEGSVVIEAGAAGTQALGAGSFFYAPRGVAHAFRNESSRRAKLLVLATPATNIVQMFGEMNEAAAIAGGMAAISEIVHIAQNHGVTMIDPAA